MDTTINSLLPSIQLLINESLKTSPTAGNGYGIALAVLVLILVAISGYFVWRQRLEDKERRTSREEITAAIKGELGSLRTDHDAAIGQFRKEMQEVRDRLAGIGERIARLEK